MWLDMRLPTPMASDTRNFDRFVRYMTMGTALLEVWNARQASKSEIEKLGHALKWIDDCRQFHRWEVQARPYIWLFGSAEHVMLLNYFDETWQQFDLEMETALEIGLQELKVDVERAEARS